MQDKTPTTPDERSAEFVAVKGGGEAASAEALLAGAYAVMWALLLGFLLLSWRRQRSIETRIVQLERALQRAERSGAGDPDG